MLKSFAVAAAVRNGLGYELGGIPVLTCAVMAVVSIALLQSGHLQAAGMPGAFALMWSIGFFFFAIGETLVIWRSYFGGGLIMAFLASAMLAHVGFIGADDAKYLTDSVIDNRFMHFLLVALVAASLLGVKRRTLTISLMGYIPILVCGVAGAMLLGVLAGSAFGIDAGRIITHYVLPIMGGGNAAGAIPMAEVYSDSTGRDGAEYYVFAISVLTVANLIAVLMAAALNQLGKRFPALTGNGQLIRNASAIDMGDDEKGTGANKINSLAAIFFSLVLLLLSFVLYRAIPSVHMFAWAVLLTLLLNLLDIVPRDLVASLQAVSDWALKSFLVLVLVAVGFMTDINELIYALNITNLIIVTTIVIGAVLGAGICGALVRFYPIEAAIAAGLCMANRGGSGDIEVLSAARRLELFPYAQLSTRIGGGMVLFLAGYLFKVLL